MAPADAATGTALTHALTRTAVSGRLFTSSMVVTRTGEERMRFALTVAAVLLLPVTMVAQTGARSAPQAHPPAASLGTTAPEFPFPAGLHLPTGLFDQFWNDPAFAAELRLTDAQRKQLQDAALTQRLSLIDGGADALKALARLSALLEADRLDDAAYRQQLSNLAAATGKLIEDVGEMAVAPRRVLTVEQWGKLQSLQRAKQVAARPAASPALPAPATPAGNRP
jgi:Spy/CpxP family protein refolding chaperone